MYRNPGWWISISLALACTGAAAAEADFSDCFHRDRYEITLMSGAMFSPIGADHLRGTENYTLSGLQFGWMLTEPGEDRWWRGNWELSLEAMGGAVYDGKGSFIAGGTLWVRYNFVQSGWRVVPYLALGAGAEGTDMDRELIGQTFNFNLEIAPGVRWMVAPNWSVDLELRYQHISNAKLSKHDIGINAVGPMVGVSYFF